jgi:hypothetical protein
MHEYRRLAILAVLFFFLSLMLTLWALRLLN